MPSPRSAFLFSCSLFLGACAGSNSQTAGPPTPGASPSHVSAAADPLAAGCDAAVDQALEVESVVFDATERFLLHLTPCAANSQEPLPVLYLLHGANNTEEQWIDVGALAEADKGVVAGTFPPAIIVVPDAASAYRCSGCGAELTQHLLGEIEPMVAEIAPVDTAHRAIGGISRGGGLALDVAGGSPGDFVAVGAHSAVPASDAALVALAGTAVPVYLDCGNEDYLVDASIDMTARLQELDGEVEFTLSDGAHKDPYWHDHVADYLVFYGSHLAGTAS